MVVRGDLVGGGGIVVGSDRRASAERVTGHALRGMAGRLYDQG